MGLEFGTINFDWFFFVIFTSFTLVISVSLSSRNLVGKSILKCQFKPLIEAAILDAAIVLGEYLRNWCSEKKVKFY